MKWKIRLLKLSILVPTLIAGFLGYYFVCNWQSAFVGMLIGAGSILNGQYIGRKIAFYELHMEHKRYEEGNDLR
jgi:DMSO reductase anchor subunit